MRDVGRDVLLGSPSAAHPKERLEAAGMAARLADEVRRLARQRRAAYAACLKWRQNGQLVPASLADEIRENSRALTYALESYAEARARRDLPHDPAGTPTPSTTHSPHAQASG